MIDELIDETIRRIEATEGRSRSRAEKPKVSFDHAVRHILLSYGKQASVSLQVRSLLISAAATTQSTMRDTVTHS